ncbi:MAG: 30S ribosomal protein S11 [Verrucomicrobiota bacterium]
MSDKETKPVEEEKVEAVAEEVAVEEEKVAEEAPAATEETAAPAEGDEAPAAAEGGGDGETPKPQAKKDIFAEIMGEDPADALKVHKAKGSKGITKGIVHVKATFNNTVVTVTDELGNTIGWSSAGKMGFKGSRKSTAYAAQVVSQDACRQAMSHGLKHAEVRVKGPGAGRESAVRAVQSLGIEVSMIDDVTPIPHNGCRPKKARRV